MTRKHAIPLLEWLDDEGDPPRGAERVAGPRAAAEAAAPDEGDDDHG
ncbi:MAG: hypothetical protein R3F43_12685 [bacterium]